MPSGAHSAHTTMIGAGASRSTSSSHVCTSDPPVASIGSITITGRPASDSGSLLTYGFGRERLLVPADPDEADVGVGQQLLGGVHEPEPGPQDRHHHRLHGEPPGRRRRQRRLDRRRRPSAAPRSPAPAAACRCARGSGGTGRSASCLSRIRASASTTSGWSTTVTVTVVGGRVAHSAPSDSLGPQQGVAGLDDAVDDPQPLGERGERALHAC